MSSSDETEPTADASAVSEEMASPSSAAAPPSAETPDRLSAQGGERSTDPDDAPGAEVGEGQKSGAAGAKAGEGQKLGAPGAGAGEGQKSGVPGVKAGGGQKGVAPRAPLAELGMGAAWLVGLSAVGQMVAVLFRANPLAILVLQAVIVDLALGRVGVRWDPAVDEDTGSDYRVVARRVGVGVGAALGVVAAVAVICLALGWATPAVHTSATSLGIGLVRAIAIGVRDGLLYAGLPLYFVGRARGTPVMAGVVFGALAAGAGLALQPAATPAGVALAIGVGAAAAAFWAHDGAGWAAAGVAGGFPFIAGAALRGGLLDLEWKQGTLAPGLAAAGGPAWLGAAGFVALAGMVMWRAQGRAKGAVGGMGGREGAS